MTDEKIELLLKQTLEMAAENFRLGIGGPFAAIIMKNGKEIARSANMVTSTNDPTAHAEIVTIRKACEALNSFSLEGCEIISSCEPCPMCLSAIYWARIDKLYYAAGKADAAKAGFDDDYIYKEIKNKPRNRKLPSRQIKVSGYRKPFNEWVKFENKKIY